MNTFSFFLITAFGFIFGLIFSDILSELGLEKKYAHSGIAVVALAFLSFIGFITSSFFILGVFDISVFMQRVGEFYNANNGIFLWMTVALVAGGFARLCLRKVLEKEHAPVATSESTPSATSESEST